MKNMMKISVVALAIIAHGACSGMMTVYQKGNAGHQSMNRGSFHGQGQRSLVSVSSDDSKKISELEQPLTFDGFVHVADKGDLKIMLNMRATDRDARDTIKIAELVAAQKFMLIKEPGFFIDAGSFIHATYFKDGQMTKNRADTLGMNYGPNAFSADGTFLEHDGELWRSAIRHYTGGKDYFHLCRLENKNMQNFKRVFGLAEKLEDKSAQAKMLGMYFSDDYGHVSAFASWVIGENENEERSMNTARNLLEANPYPILNSGVIWRTPDYKYWRSSRQGEIQELRKIALSQRFRFTQENRDKHSEDQHCTIL